ncbi:MAG: hypothetical protein WC428_05785 [Candidatus Paceibacterota bacterium]|jgi:3-hydroxy-3-methylglutaryl CoA synthase
MLKSEQYEQNLNKLINQRLILRAKLHSNEGLSIDEYEQMRDLTKNIKLSEQLHKLDLKYLMIQKINDRRIQIS